MSDILKNLDNLFHLSTQPVAAAEGDLLVYSNPAWKKLFSVSQSPQNISALLPNWPYAPDSVISATLSDREYCITITQFEHLLVLMLTESVGTKNVDLTPFSALNSMISTSTTPRRAADRLSVLCGIGEQQSLYISILYHNYYKLLRTTEHLSTLSALKSERYTLDLAELELGAFLSDLASSVRHLTQDSGVILEYDAPNELITVSADAHLMELLFLGLLSNALGHTDAGGRIAVHLSQKRNMAIVSVTDNGSGMAPDILASAFQLRGFADSLELPSPDSGLGLPLASAIAARHGGTVILESREGRGTTVRVSIQLLKREKLLLRTPAPVYGTQVPIHALTELSTVLSRSQYTPDKLFCDQ